MRGKKKPWLKVTAATLLMGLVLAPCHAVTPDEVLKDPVLESRARALSQQLRCVVCQNQSIDDSNAPLAHDLRVLLRERLAAGDSDQQATDFLVARYGNFVLLKPPLHWNTVPLWIGPFLILLIAGIGFRRYFGRSKHAATPEAPSPLSDNEEQRLEMLLGDGRSV
ncbi:MAG TPA: cytochrome c-type biogenesis protein [Acidobacteriaceae bacterium]|nr:cytochrome c-type biogenesis protein [Acidobacteriaceae bacterium]